MTEKACTYDRGQAGQRLGEMLHPVVEYAGYLIRMRRNRRALVMTLTELNAMAAPAADVHPASQLMGR